MNLRCYSDNNFQAYPVAEELLLISNEISRDYSPTAPSKSPAKKANTSLSAQELLQVSQNISRFYAPQKLSKNTSLSLLAIDPRHLYIGWNLAENNLSSLLQSINSNELLLRVYALSEKNEDSIYSKLLSEIPVHSIQFQKKIKVPVTSEQTVYSAYIGKCTPKNNFISLVKSNELHTCMPVTTPPSINAIDFDDTDLIEPVQSHSVFNSINSHYASTNQSGQRKSIGQSRKIS